MSEYIDREALPQKKERVFFLDDDFNAGWNACLNNIESIPAADVWPVARVSWVKRRFGENCVGYECLNCHTTWDAPTNYCPNCGARMEES